MIDSQGLDIRHVSVDGGAGWNMIWLLTGFFIVT